VVRSRDIVLVVCWCIEESGVKKASLDGIFDDVIGRFSACLYAKA
jgi:hypothetical protein